MRFCLLTYEEMLPCKEDYRLILHDPDDNRKYYGLKNDDGVIVACLECTEKIHSVHVDCVYVPEQFRGKHLFLSLLNFVLDIYKGKRINAQANDWSIKTFLRAGFTVKSKKKFLYWTAYYVFKDN